MRDATSEQRGVAACTDAERRRAEELARALRRSGRDARVVALWVRPAWRLVQTLCAVAAVGASVLAVDSAITGLAIAAAALLLAAADLSSRPLLRRLTPARATQNVISTAPPRPGSRPVTLILTASTDDPRRGLAAALPLRITSATLGAQLLLVALLAARAAGSDGLWLDAAQLLPTLALLALIALLLERPAPTPQPAPAADRVLALAQRLDELPPHNLDVAVVLAGAGEDHAAGLRTWLRERRKRGLDPDSVAIVNVEPNAGESAVWWERDGLVVGAPMHAQLVHAARRAAPQSSEPGGRRAVTTAAGIVRVDGWPAISIRADVAFAHALVTELDAALGERHDA